MITFHYQARKTPGEKNHPLAEHISALLYPFRFLSAEIAENPVAAFGITADISANLVDYQGAFLRAERAKASVFAAIRAIGQRRLNFLLLV